MSINSDFLFDATSTQRIVRMVRMVRLTQHWTTSLTHSFTSDLHGTKACARADGCCSEHAL